MAVTIYLNKALYSCYNLRFFHMLSLASASRPSISFSAIFVSSYSCSMNLRKSPRSRCTSSNFVFIRPCFIISSTFRIFISLGIFFYGVASIAGNLIVPVLFRGDFDEICLFIFSYLAFFVWFFLSF